MSTLVELPPDQFNSAAFDDFQPADVNFTTGNARAMMWMSQLAYETHKQETIDHVKSLFQLDQITAFFKRAIGNDSFDSRGIIAEGRGAVILAFAGTDPAVWENLATDINIGRARNEDIRRGFRAAFKAVQPRVDEAAGISRRTGHPLFITGHSPGAALAGQHADATGAAPRAVYVFGMPRAGGRWTITLGSVR